MNDLEQTRSNPSSDDATPNHPSERKRERRGWLFWVGLVLALVALTFYMLSGDLGGWYRGQPRQPVATTTAK